MAKTVYSVQSIETLVAELRHSFSELGVNIASFRVLSTGTENRFALLRQLGDGTQIATEVSGSMLRRLKETLFSADNLGLLCGSKPNSDQAFDYAQRLAEQEQAERTRIAEEQAAREAEKEAQQERDHLMAGAAKEAAKNDILSMLRNMSPSERAAFFDSADA